MNCEIVRYHISEQQAGKGPAKGGKSSFRLTMSSSPSHDLLPSKIKKRRREISEKDIENRLLALREEKKKLSRASRSSRYSAPQSASPIRDGVENDITHQLRSYKSAGDREMVEEEEGLKAKTSPYPHSHFKEVILADLTQYREGKRLEAEISSGSGDTVCGNVHECSSTVELEKYKVPCYYRDIKKSKSTISKHIVSSRCFKKHHVIAKRQPIPSSPFYSSSDSSSPDNDVSTKHSGQSLS